MIVGKAVETMVASRAVRLPTRDNVAIMAQNLKPFLAGGLSATTTVLLLFWSVEPAELVTCSLSGATSP